MVHPIVFDVYPDLEASSGRPASVLLAPVGDTTLVERIWSSLGPSAHRLTILSAFEPCPDYIDEVRAACDGFERVMTASDFRPAELFEPGDWLLFLDPRCYAPRLGRLPTVLRDAERGRSQATHLIGLSRHSGGTSERVELSAAGRVRRIQRYYDRATWPFLHGVACSLVSSACFGTTTEPHSFQSLVHLRASLAERGILSRDVSIEEPVFDLAREDELIRLNEHLTVELARDPHGPSRLVGEGAVIHPTARLLGPVVVQGDAIVGARALIVGPAVIGSGARVESEAVVVHSIVGRGVSVAANAVVRTRALLLTPDPPLHDGDERSGVPDTSAPASPVVYLHDRHAAYARVKSAIDRASAFVGLLVLSPLMALIALLIRLDSSGGAFYGDSREGEGGRPFRCLKFRTMRSGAALLQRELLARNQMDGPQFKLDKDPRLTRLGRWLRPASLDELPQLFNVLAGQMSLIGPRPSPFRENQTCVPWRDARLSVRPGITGLWQVCRNNRQEGDFHQWIYFDLLYVQHMSLWLDLRILLATLVTCGGRSSVPLEWMIPARKRRA